MKIKSNRDYTKDKATLKTFLEEHGKYDDSGNTVFIYREQLTKLAHREQIALVIDIVDIINYDEELAEAIKHNTKRYVNILLELVQEMLPNFKEKTVPPRDALDVYIEHLLLMEQRNQFAGDQRDSRNKYSPELLRRFEVYFKDSGIEDFGKEDNNVLSVRSLKAEYIGQLVTVKGIITRCTEVKPMLTVATYTCDQCGAETYQEIHSMAFLPLQNCETEDCRVNKSGGRLYIQTKGSKFIKFQELKLQEESDQVPVGEIPRSLTVYCRGETTRKCQPGDHVYITGILLPKMKSGYASVVSSTPLLTDTFFDVHEIITKSDADNVDETDEFTAEELEILKQDDIYSKLAMSIAPEIYGMEDVKKALLLLLVGCTEKVKGDMKIRGNINICLMGDPGVAKSQLLSFITRLSPRSQFTTGRGSSSVGLTAAVVKDPLTGQMVLEGGALVLADKGVCCIDEFDKMTEGDRTAIHEVMEQQTISIAKAGIMTRLNARASILAAANPAYGKYNINRSVEQNIALPAALLSRFDLLWLLQDVANRSNDMKLAEHITYVHRNYEKPTVEFDVIDMHLMKKYINLCKRKNPVIPESLRDTIVESYIKMRNESRNQKKDRTFTSARNLLAILRLSIALARLRLANVVDESDVEEANRLIKQSKISINESGDKKENQKKETQLYVLVREIAGKRKSIKVSDIIERSINQGFTVEQVMDFIDQYENINIWQINQNKTVLTFI